MTDQTNGQITNQVNNVSQGEPQGSPTHLEGEKLEQRRRSSAEATARYREANPDKIRESKKLWNEQHKDEVREAGKRYREANRERVLAAKRAYRERNREKIQEYERNRRPKPEPRPKKVLVVLTEKPRRVKVIALTLEPELQKAITDFLNAKVTKSEQTVEWYKNALHYLSQYLAINDLCQWPPDPDDINAFLADLKRRGRMEATLDNYYRAIRGWLNWLTLRKRINGDVVGMIEKPVAPKPLPKVVQPSDVAKLLNAIERSVNTRWEHCRDLALLTLALDTGARISELASITLDRLDMEHRTFKAVETKSSKDRMIIFSDLAAERLSRWLEVRAGLPAPAGLNVFISLYRNNWCNLTVWGIRQVLERWLKRAGVAHFNFHRLRHTHAVYSLRAGTDLLDLQKQLGHSNLSTTAIYTQIDDAGRVERHARHNPLSYLNDVAA